ncbi:PREDICTED: cytochrome b561 and DOMON domain-containing protein At2g04850-like [Ipomoea nil]|uniref:cytochrome b561 and DOMON domain-containing protein At2g04850-like n=1 Tax=Ipomoea nil TaxID=35883 RepID=UPI0009019D97|nr:PREDICTED: cytochrome b561 and DOMON domain-containing protein At2g04850-like [Ipomoea nil]
MLFSSSHYSCILTFVVVFALSLSTISLAADCSRAFYSEVQNLIGKIGRCKKLASGAEFGWNYTNQTRQLKVLIGARVEAETGWLAWGLNPGPEPQMVGTRALILIKTANGSLLCGKYNVTASVKLGCTPLLPSDIDLNVTSPNCSVLGKIGYYTIQASINLPMIYNVSRLNHVWQTGDAADGAEPKMHHTSLRNFDSAEAFDLNTGKVASFVMEKRQQMRLAHGIFNIVGWGTFLPAGVIAARYFKSFPFAGRHWFPFHVGCQIIGYSLGVVGWGLGLWLGHVSKYYTFRTHRITAIFIFTFATLQMLALRLKPEKRDEYRKHWNKYHHFLGYALLVVIAYNIFKGISVLRQEEKAWRSGYAVVIAVLVSIFLGCEVYTWIRFCCLRKKGDKIPKNNEKDQDDKGLIPTGVGSSTHRQNPPSS